MTVSIKRKNISKSKASSSSKKYFNKSRKSRSNTRKMRKTRKMKGGDYTITADNINKLKKGQIITINNVPDGKVTNGKYMINKIDIKNKVISEIFIENIENNPNKYNLRIKDIAEFLSNNVITINIQEQK